MPFHENIPLWISNYIEGKECRECKNVITKKDIIAIGIRKITDKNMTPFIEHNCSKCHSRAITSFGGHQQGNMEEICHLLLSQIKINKSKPAIIGNIQARIKERSNKNTTPISEEEASKFVKYLQKSKNHENFMKQIGALNYHKTLKKIDKNKNEGR